MKSDNGGVIVIKAKPQIFYILMCYEVVMLNVLAIVIYSSP